MARRLSRPGTRNAGGRRGRASGHPLGGCERSREEQNLNDELREVLEDAEDEK
jgi:hypothetical protein